MHAARLLDLALQSRTNLCPTWCEREHLGLADDPCGFHHDGEVVAVPVESPVAPRSGDHLYVNISQRERRGEVEPAFVEVQDEHQTLVLLTPAECVALAEALLDAAERIRDEDSTLETWVRPLVAQLENTLTHLVPL